MARPVKIVAGHATGMAVAHGVIVATGVIGALEAGVATAEPAVVATAVAEVLGTETADPETIAESGEIPATKVAASDLTGMATVRGTIAANSAQGDLPVATMGADDGQARRVDASDAFLGPLDNAV